MSALSKAALEAAGVQAGMWDAEEAIRGEEFATNVDSEAAYSQARASAFQLYERRVSAGMEGDDWDIDIELLQQPPLWTLATDLLSADARAR